MWALKARMCSRRQSRHTTDAQARRDHGMGCVPGNCGELNIHGVDDEGLSMSSLGVWILSGEQWKSPELKSHRMGFVLGIPTALAGVWKIT